MRKVRKGGGGPSATAAAGGGGGRYAYSKGADATSSDATTSYDNPSNARITYDEVSMDVLQIGPELEVTMVGRKV